MKKVKIEDPKAESPVPDSGSSTETTTEPVTPETPQTSPAPKDDSSAQITELTNDLQRTRADFENYRKQSEAQKSQAMAAARYATVNQFLPLVDDLLRAIDAYPEQLEPLRKNFEKTLSSLGLSQVQSAAGVEFNPDLHEAVSIEDSDGETEVIAETLRPGYLYDGVVIRPAMVKVTRQ